MTFAELQQDGLCACGCGQQTTVYKGRPRRFCRGHQVKAQDWQARIVRHRALWGNAGIPYGLCLCGCGERTPISAETEYERHWIKGEPRPWVPRHHLRRSPSRWIEEDRGYDSPCWIWQWSRTGPYGQARGGLAHRVVYTERVGPVPDGLHLDHLCRVALCVNPDHLEPVTQQENNRRQWAAIRSEAA